jgi:zinc protease
MHIPFARRTLANGLDVIVHEDHALPIVAVNIWYHVGSKNERVGRTGFAHLFEHLMFEGSAHHDSGYFAPLQRAGASVNGSTSADRTNYWEVIPVGALELALWLESDRMGFLLPALTAQKFETQREVVLNERRQNYENRPYGMASIALANALYDEAHPYRWPTIGYADDLRAATLDEVHAFFARYYHPANASLVLAGDIDTEAAFALAERYFADIPAGPPVEPVTAAPPGLDADRLLLLEDRVELPRLYIAWHSPALFRPGDAEFDLLAEMLGGGKTSRLYRRLVVERRLATEVVAVQGSRELSGLFQAVATAAPDVTLDALRDALLEEIDAVCESPVTPDEFERARVQVEAHFVYRLQTVGGFSGKSDQLNAYNVYCGDPGYMEHDRARYRDATTADVLEAASTWLRRPSVSLGVVPMGKTVLGLTGAIPAVAS